MREMTMELCNTTQLWVANMRAMLVLLDAEFSALKEKKQEAILLTSREKEALLAELSAQEKNLLDSAQATGFTGHDLFEHIARHCGQEWAQSTLETSQQVQQANQRNGALLQSMIRLNEHALNLLTGKQPKVNTYGASGQIETSVSQLTKLATA
jgi:flagellar biosynthesis/type III secretory pathway chaperone